MAGNVLASYKLQLAKDDKFTAIVHEKTEKIGTAFDVKKLSIPDGNYFMRVAFIDALGESGQFSVPTAIVKDTAPPVISTLVPEEGQSFGNGEGFCDVIGSVQDAAMVSVNGEVVFISATGRFNSTVSLKPGQNTIKVVARDVNGNETVVLRKVTFAR
jgi:bacillopeptidase F